MWPNFGRTSVFGNVEYIFLEIEIGKKLISYQNSSEQNDYFNSTKL